MTRAPPTPHPSRSPSHARAPPGPQVGKRVTNGAEVVGYETAPDGITGILADGTRVHADMLVGSEGIRSKIRDALDPTDSDPTWSGFTCFAAIANCVPDDVKTVGYKVYLGPRKYFVSVDVGGGRIQWYAFLNEPPGSLNIQKGDELRWLKQQQFGEWSEEVHQLIDATPADQVEQRDLYDRPPRFRWTDGRVCLLGDAAHPMMPNLGQGGGMAIEDSLVLGQELRRLGDPTAVPTALKAYERNRVMRAATVHGMSRLSSAILFQYNHPTVLKSIAPLHVEHYGPRSLITRACQGFLQNVAFPLQFEFLFSFPDSLDPNVFADPSSGDFGTRRTMRDGDDADTPSERGDAERELLKGGMGLKDWLGTYW